MNSKTAQTFIEKQLKDLNVPETSVAWTEIYPNAVAAAEVLTKKELVRFIEETLELMPNSNFYA